MSSMGIYPSLRRLLKVSAAALVVAVGFVAPPAFAEESSTPLLAALPSATNEVHESVSLPTVLSDEDVARYKKIISLQEQGKWKAADKEINKLSDKILLGHIKAQRYLHPRKYRSSYKELKGWLDSYNDLPQAQQLYKLAKKRRPKNWKPPKPPVAGSLRGSGHDGNVVRTKYYNPSKRLSKNKKQRVYQLKRRMKFYQRKGWTKSVKTLLRTKEVKRLFHPVEYDRVQATLAAGYYADGRDTWAIEWAGRAAKRSGKYLPEAHWTLGLASWRLGKFDQAHKHFEKVATSEYASPWMISAGAFWAARVNLVDGKPHDVNHMLAIAAAYPRTFYGMLGKHMLNHKPSFDWSLPPLNKERLTNLLKTKGAQRALALFQIGEYHKGERELRGLYSRVDKRLVEVILSLATRANMPSLAMRLGNMLASSGRGQYDSASYPLPGWVPKDGFKVDKALLFAIMRQESGFNPEAKSYAGARGLMQLMPRTASFVAKDRRFRHRNNKMLFDPHLNLSTGQDYVKLLLKERTIDNDLFLMVAAWNGGPGNLRRWLKTVKHHDDPLLFIESIPSKETRNFVERVFTNLWIYRDRFGQQAPSLQAIAAGEWPVYIPLDFGPLRVTENVKDRR
ncbi:MAG: lytic transglycosylase domain-containing protein [Rhodospirillales bacterium]|nr:lytic transglycosylase domain-containing protein [Rhodospirillales bacterium]